MPAPLREETASALTGQSPCRPAVASDSAVSTLTGGDFEYSTDGGKSFTSAGVTLADGGTVQADAVLVGVGDFIRQMITGGVIILAVVLDTYRLRSTRRGT